MDKRRKALFIDRDGILNEVVFRNELVSSPRCWEEVRLLPEMDRLSEVKALGFLLIMVTNQPDLERGLLEPDFVVSLHSRYRSKYHLDATYVCPHADNDHPSKKPNPGMFLQAAKEWDIDLGQSYHLGDTFKDIDAALTSGCTAILWDRSYNSDVACSHRVGNFDALMQVLTASS